MKIGKWKLSGILILTVLLLFFSREIVTQIRISRSISKTMEQYPELRLDTSPNETNTVLESVFKDKLPPVYLLRITMIWKNNQWILTSVSTIKSCLDDYDIQESFNEDIAPLLPPPVSPAAQGWFSWRQCEIVGMGKEVKVSVEMGLTDTVPMDRELRLIHPIRDFGYPVGQSPEKDLLQKELRQQEIHLDEKEKDKSFMGEALIKRDPSRGKVSVNITLKDVANPLFKEGLEEILSSFYQSLLKFNSSVTISVKDEFGEVEKELTPGISIEKMWIIRLPSENGFLYYMEPVLE